MSEFFFRCSAEFLQIEYGGKKDKDSIRLWFVKMGPNVRELEPFGLSWGVVLQQSTCTRPL